MGNVAIFKGKLVKFLAKAGILVPARPDADRSLTPTAGETAFNTTANKLEVYDGTGWTQLGAGGGSGNGLVHPTSGSTFESGEFSPSMNGTGNTAIGYLSSKFIYSGSSNTTLGAYSGLNLYSATGNTFVGDSAGYNTDSDTNTGIGFQALYSNIIGTSNVAVGYNAGYNTSGSNNTLVNATGTSSISGSVVIGKDSSGTSASASENNQFVLGTANHKYMLPGKIGTVVQIGPNGTSSGQTGTIKLFELSGNGTNSIALKAPDNIAADVSLTLPSTVGSANQVLTTDGTTGTLSWSTPSSGGTYQLQSLTGTQTLSTWVSRLSALHTKNTNARQSLMSYIHGLSSLPVQYAYAGGVYSPTQNRIYFAPYGQSSSTTWHYIDCTNGNTVSYSNGGTAPQYAYLGGVYSPTQNRIYFAPANSINSLTWQYINCTTGAVVEYNSPGLFAVTTPAYVGGVYSPTQNRIYFIPNGISSQTNWHYIDCATGNVVSYAHGVTVNNFSYSGGVYSPTQNRIYFVPAAQATQTNWHYIDCNTGNVVAYAHGATAVASAYYSGVYSPTQNRIYFCPQQQASQANWHYIDCNTGSVVAYAHGVTAVTGAYLGGVYSPTQNRIYFVPGPQSNQTNWHYVDCSNGSIVAYSPGATVAADAYQGGCYSPTQNRIYFAPRSVSNTATWHCITSTAKADMEPHELGSTIISSTF